MKLIKGDMVKITVGKDKGKTGKIQKVVKNTNKVVLEGLNLVKRHQKTRAGVAGGIIEKTHPIAQSNVVIVCKHCQKVTRVGFKITDKGKVRICKKCQEQLS